LRAVHDDRSRYPRRNGRLIRRRRPSWEPLWFRQAPSPFQGGRAIGARQISAIGKNWRTYLASRARQVCINYSQLLVSQEARLSAACQWSVVFGTFGKLEIFPPHPASDFLTVFFVG
jgi:hypothetical protein